MRFAMTMVVVMVAACGDDSGGPSDAAANVEMIMFGPGTPGCFMGTLADVDMTMAGAQYDCSATRTATDKVYPKCNDQTIPARSTNQPCWAVATLSADCTMGARYQLQIIPQVTEAVSAQCVVK